MTITYDNELLMGVDFSDVIIILYKLAICGYTEYMYVQ